MRLITLLTFVGVAGLPLPSRGDVRTDAPVGRYTVSSREEKGDPDAACVKRASAAMQRFREMTIVFKRSITINGEEWSRISKDNTMEVAVRPSRDPSVVLTASFFRFVKPSQPRYGYASLDYREPNTSCWRRLTLYGRYEPILP